MTVPASTPAGWYPDTAGSLRWWDGYRWTEHTQAPASTPVAPPRVPDGTSPTTRWIWWIVLLPAVSMIPLAFYLVEVTNGMRDLLPLFAELSGPGAADPTVVDELVASQFGLVFTPWYLVLLLVGWSTAAIVIWFSYLDRRDLMARGFVRPFHWAWAFLSTPLVYVIGRTVVVRRQTGGRGGGPLWVLIAVEVALLILAFVWMGWFMVVLTQDLMTQFPVS